MKWGLGCIGVIVVVIVIAALVIGGGYVSARNQMVTLNEQVKSNWAQVDVVLQRRADLIPNLVSTVKGFAAHEETVFGDIANARAALMGATTPAAKIAANGMLDGALVRLLAIKENYPDLKSNENFLRLQDELTGTENRIAVSRRDYNLAIQKYNTDVELFPKNLAASVFGFKRDDAYFKTTDEEKKVPQVKF